MSRRDRVVLAVWLAVLVAAATLALRARYVTDLSALLPTRPAPGQRLLGDLLRDGPAAKTILAAIEGGSAADRAGAARTLVARSLASREFSTVDDGDRAGLARAQRFVFEHRYVLDAAAAAHLSTAQALHRAIRRTIEDLATPAGPWLVRLLPHDPTGETARLAERWTPDGGPPRCDGVWCSRSGERALLVLRTRAAGSDTDGQANAIATIRGAFRTIAGPNGRLRLRLSGPPVFAVQARARIERSAERLSVIAGACVVALLLLVYRSPAAVLLGLLPVATAATVGVAAVAGVFGAVQGMTLGFGVTLIGEAVDYAIYFFLQSAHAADAWRQRYWPTIRLGALTSICGFAALLPSGFPGLEQLGVYCLCGLAAAAATTRYVLPRLATGSLDARSVASLGAALRRALPAPRIGAALLGGLAVASLAVLLFARGGAWSHDLAALSPVPAAERRFDGALRADLGAADVRDLVVAQGADRERALQAAERAARSLRRLEADRVIGGFDDPATILPSLSAQRARQRALPDARTLAARLHRALVGLPVHETTLAPFLADVAAARAAPPLTRRDLDGTPLAAAFDALLLRRRGRWIALLPLRAPLVDGRPGSIDLPRVREAVSGRAEAIDLEADANGLYAVYLRNALRASAVGVFAITVLLAATLRSVRRTLRVLAPLAVAVGAVAAALALAGIRLTILHLVGMLLIVAIGSNYALFFVRHGADDDGAITGSLAIANAATVIGFGLLATAPVPVLRDLGLTVAPGALLAFLCSALLAPTAPGASARIGR
ncbi:MAG: MMPL family transporter [Gammaproteobacteria bacterium]|nr:MMPL family transporter [Gammaproteobacteria bacterium]